MAPRPMSRTGSRVLKSTNLPQFLLMPQRPHKTPLDRANSFLHEAERGIKTDPDNAITGSTR